MRSQYKEIAIGIILALLTFMALQGFDILPIILIGGGIVALRFLIENKSLGGRRFEVVGGGGLQTSGIPRVTFEDIGGQEVAKRELREALDFMSKDARVRRLGIRPLKGILLAGPPGTGKTLMAKAAAYYTDSLFFAASGSQFVEMYAGVGAQRIRQLFKKAQSDAQMSGKNRAIVFIDEIDVLGVKRGQNSSHMEYDQTLNELLTQIDGIRVHDSVRLLVIAATNRADMLDEALLRPGRFDRVVQVGLPDRAARLQILKIHGRNKPLAEDVDLGIVAKETFGMSGAHLENIMNEAAIQAMRGNRDFITVEDMREAMEKVLLGEKLDRLPSQAEKERIAYHETGHALISELVKPGSVSSVTVTSRGNALGYMRQSPSEDRYLYTKSELLGHIQVCMAGAVSEELIFGQRSTGALGDIDQGLKIARQLIFAGLSDLGVVGRDLPDQVMQKACSEIIQGQEKLVMDILSQKVEVLHQIAKYLLEQEKVSGDEFRNLIQKQSA